MEQEIQQLVRLFGEYYRHFQLKFAISNHSVGGGKCKNSCACRCNSNRPNNNCCNTVYSMQTPISLIHQRLQLRMGSTNPLLHLIIQLLVYQL